MEEALDKFRCYKDKDIESFLRFKAIEFEKRGFCTVYLILDANEFDRGKISIQAYFTLSHKAIDIGKDVSRRVRGVVATHRYAEIVHFVLIGQLGRYLIEDKENDNREMSITAEDILNDAFDIIEKSSEFIVCRGVLVECSMEQKVQNIYKEYGFSFFQNDKMHCQFYRKICNII